MTASFLATNLAFNIFNSYHVSRNQRMSFAKNEELNEKNEILALILNKIPMGIFIIDKEERLLFNNEPLIGILELNPHEDIQKQIKNAERNLATAIKSTS